MMMTTMTMTMKSRKGSEIQLCPVPTVVWMTIEPLERLETLRNSTLGLKCGWS